MPDEMSVEDVVRTEIEMLCYGVRSDFLDARKGGAGPIGGRCLILPHGLVKDVPVRGDYVAKSPYALQKRGDEYWITKHGTDVFKVELVGKPAFYEKTTSDGIPMSKFAKLHGTNTIGITADRYCKFWHLGNGCGYCAIGIEVPSYNGISLMRKRPEWIGEVVDAAYEEGVCKSVTMSMGIPNSESDGAKLYCDITREIKRRQSNVGVHVQFIPPQNLELIDGIYASGADTMGIHVDVFQKEVMEKVVPGKFRIGRNAYLRAWKHAVEVFGENQVSTFLLAGLGETEEGMKESIEEICSTGAIPYVLPHRPLLETSCGHMHPPKPDYLLRLLGYTKDAMHGHGIDIFENKGGCMACGACSALHDVTRFNVAEIF